MSTLSTGQPLMDVETVNARKLVQLGQDRAALVAFEQALRRNPRDVQLLTDFSHCCARLGAVENEANLLRELEPAAPNSPALLAYLGQALAEVGEYDASLRAYERALAINPDVDSIRVGYGMALLRQGDFLRGWEFYNARESMKEIAQFTESVKVPRYTGGNLSGRTILLLGEQGLGDTLMFARYAPMLVKRGARVVIVAHKEVIELLRTIPGVWQAIPFGASLPPFQTYARLLGLPQVFSTTLWNVPHQVPYLRASPIKVERWRTRIAADGHSSNRKVGIVWAGNAAHSRDPLRSIHLSELAPLADVPNTIYYSLQKGARQEEADTPPAGMRVVNLSKEINDFSDLAGVIQSLDLVITVDTAPAHLAGGLGKPVWTLLPFSPDWRWLVNRDDSPWYPSMRLFRQPNLRDWSSMIVRVRDALMQLSDSPLT